MERACERSSTEQRSGGRLAVQQLEQGYCDLGGQAGLLLSLEPWVKRDIAEEELAVFLY